MPRRYEVDPQGPFYLGDSDFASVPSGIRTPAENAASVTPVNYSYPPGNVLRYGTNTTPGTTDMSAALQASINVALASVGDGPAGTLVHIPSGAYLITTPPTFGAVNPNYIPIEIRGDGWGTQLINNAPANTAATFNMSGRHGWRIKDLCLCGNSAHKNDGIQINNVGTFNIYWHIDNVLSLMPGHGIYAADTNTGVIQNFVAWPGNTAGLLQVAQTVNVADIQHHIYFTGSYALQISIYDAWCSPNTNYAGGANAHRGIKVDSSQSQNIQILDALVQTLSGTNVEIGIELTGNVIGAILIGIYHEGAQILFDDVSNSYFSGGMHGGVGGSLLLNGSSQYNIFECLFIDTITITDFGFEVGTIGNTFINCRAATFNGTSSASNRFINCALGSSLYADYGGTKTVALTYSASMTPNSIVGEHFLIVATDGVAFTINAPTSPVRGRILVVRIRNTSGGVLGAVTWNAIYKLSAWAQPGNGFSRSISFRYDGTNWIQESQTGVDVPN